MDIENQAPTKDGYFRKKIITSKPGTQGDVAGTSHKKVRELLVPKGAVLGTTFLQELGDYLLEYFQFKLGLNVFHTKYNMCLFSADGKKFKKAYS